MKLYERAGAAAIRFEDAAVNEYGAAPEELAIAPTAVVIDQIKAAVDGRRDAAFVGLSRAVTHVPRNLSIKFASGWQHTPRPAPMPWASN